MNMKDIMTRGPSPFKSNDEGIACVTEAIETVLNDVAEPGISTSELGRRLGAKAGGMKALTPWIALARKTGALDGYFTQGAPHYGTFGKPAYLWHAAKPKPAMTQDQRRTWMKENDPETYTLLYGTDDAGQ